MECKSVLRSAVEPRPTKRTDSAGDPVFQSQCSPLSRGAESMRSRDMSRFGLSIIAS